MDLATSKYGPLTDVVSLAGALMAAAVALLRLVRGRAKWEPAEEDVPSAYERVSAVLAAVLVGLLWWRFSDGSGSDALARLTLAAVGLLATALIIYSLLIGTKVYDVVYIDRNESIGERKIIGGFWLTPYAKAQLRSDPRANAQDLLAGMQYDPDRVWSRMSRALAKLAFTISAISLTLGLSVALSGAALLLR